MTIARRNLLLGSVAVAAGTVISAQALAAGRIDSKLSDLNIVLPESGPAPVANYVPTLIEGSMVYISGQIPFRGKELAFKGRLGAELTLEDGRAATRMVGLNMLALLKRQLDGDLDRVRRVVRIDGFVSSTADFFQ
jgi:enamine deaminase RidA (YjgF/YER057c/UK114 family)